MNIHFISIGGSVMHQLAIALKLKGYGITGSDDEIFEPARTNLEREGLLPERIGWFPGRITASVESIILGMHAREDNPELIKARELNLPVYSFPEYIYKESINKTRVVVGGSHGKTTTTSMIMHVLKESGHEFDYLVGARLEGFEQSVKITDAPVIICEGDEYPASAIERKPKFHFLFPHIAVLTGIAWDHINIFPTFENYTEQFQIFIQKIKTGGHLIYNESDTVLNSLVQESHWDDVYYHPYSVPEHTIKDGSTTMMIEGDNVALQVFGHHNLLNAQAAWLVCRQLNISAQQFRTAIATFTGAAKRLEVIAKNKSTIIYRDFAHAPSKVKATMEAVRMQFPSKKLYAILELHTYSSLNEAFLKEYKGVMEGGDEAVVFYSNHALELKRLPPLEKETVKNSFGNNAIHVFNHRSELEAWLKEQDINNSIVLFMSSGNYDGLDVTGFAETLLQKSAAS